MTNLMSKIMTLLALVTFTHHANCQSFSSFVESINNYQNQVKLKIQHKPKHNIIDSTTFNLSYYFGMFDKLEIKSNYKLDYVYCDFGNYGQPVFYVKHNSVNLENHLEEHVKDDFIKTGWNKLVRNKEAIDFRRDQMLFYFAKDSINNARNNIIPDDSEEGCLQYLYFYVFGENFLLFWHSNYNNGDVISSKKEMQRLFDFYMTNEDYTFENDERKILEDLQEKSFEPIIEKTKDNYIISWYENYLHFGIYKSTYKIERQPPFKITKINDEKIVSPQYGVIY